MQFTLLQNDTVAPGGGIPNVVTGMLFSCGDTKDVSLGRDKSGKNLSSFVLSKKTR
jgi:hypothetical protein